ncbi:MAG: cupredoxin domain-containing protein [Sulfuricellaceae bacterium]
MRASMFALFLFSTLAAGAEAEFSLIIRNHVFEPSEIRVPAKQKIRLIVKNMDTTPEEFESHELNREKVIPAGATVKILIGPLAPGRYPFVGEFHESTARGTVIAE